MIRDPSDGTVKEISPEANNINAVSPRLAPKEIGPVTGLRQPTRTDAQERLEESRKWLKKYHAAKERENAGADIEQKLPQAGHSIQVQRETKSPS